MPPRTRNPITRHARAIRAALTAIDRSLGRLVVVTKEFSRTVVEEQVPRKRRLTLSPARKAQLKLQGQYIGLIRNLKPAQKAKVKAVREKKGMRAAIGIVRVPSRSHR